ncbi:MAG: recombination protein RecR, partial [Psychroserpens sp.]
VLVGKRFIFAPMNLVSKVLQQAVDEFAQLPGVGQKTAFRFVLHLLKKKPEELKKFGNTFVQLQEQVQYCKSCFNITHLDTCDICSNPSRDRSTICVVEDIRDVVSIENTEQFKGLYHVLGGIISPLDGVGPSDLNIPPLMERLETGEVQEVIFALTTTMEGDTTNFYLSRQLEKFDISVSTLARGVSVGGGLEYTDELTLGRSLVNRVPYENTLAG